MRFAFYKGNSRLFNKLVRWKTEGIYSHCEAQFGENSFASSSFMDKGVRFKNIILNPEHWDVIEVPGIDEQKVHNWFMEHLGQPYDVRGLINFIIPVGNSKGWFCGEALAASLGINEPWRLDPNSLARVLEFAGGTWVSI